MQQDHLLSHHSLSLSLDLHSLCLPLDLHSLSLLRHLSPPDHAPWMDLSTQISSLGTRMEEFAIVSDTQFYSMEDRMDQY